MHEECYARKVAKQKPPKSSSNSGRSGGPFARGTADAACEPREAAALLGKRRRVSALVRPDLADALGERFQALFDGYARGHPTQAGRSAQEDAAAFGAWLADHGHLPRSGFFRRLRRQGRT